MRAAELESIREWFAGYVARFRSNGSLCYPLELKADHSRRVARECADIARDLAWSEDLTRTAEAAGLLHDVGRFTQFAEFRTFADAESFNHGERGGEIISGEGFPGGLEPSRRQTLLDATRYHNRRYLPDDVAAESLPVVKLVRDADKLDILFIINDVVRNERFHAHPEILLNVDVRGPVTPELLRELRAGRTASHRNVHSLADINLMRITWVYHMNYRPALRRLAERGHFDEMVETLPRDPEVEALIAEARGFLRARLATEA